MNSNNAKPIFIQFTIDFRVFFYFFLKIFFFNSCFSPSNLACNCYFQCIILVFFSSLNELEAAIFHTALIYTCVASSKYQQQFFKKKSIIKSGTFWLLCFVLISFHLWVTFVEYTYAYQIGRYLFRCFLPNGTQYLDKVKTHRSCNSFLSFSSQLKKWK